MDRKTARGYFADAPEDRPVIVNGQAAQGWPVEELPARLKVRLEKSARDQGYDDLGRFLRHARKRWEPAVAVGKIAQALIEAARTRCTVLAPVLRRTSAQPIAEIIREALPAWNCQGRHPLTERTLRRWIERAMERDPGFADWSRWEIFLDDELAPVAARPVADGARDLALPHLAEALAAVAVPSCSTAEERDAIWFQANKDADISEEAGESTATTQRAVLLALGVSSLPLAKTPEALRKIWTRKRAAWIDGGRRASALSDRRAVVNQDRALELPAGDKLTLLRLALKWSGDLAPAWREAIGGRLLAAETLARFPELPADKSHVPHSIRRAVGPDLAQMVQRNQGPRASRLAGAWTERDWRPVEPGDWWVGDDLTPPVYFWDEDQENPQPMRGQLLMLADAKTDFVLGWVLLSSRNYNARAIRSLITRCHDEHGLPRQGFHFEYGNLFCGCRRLRREPGRVLWLRRLIDGDVPVAFVALPDFKVRVARYQDQLGWDTAQITDIIAREVTLPPELKAADFELLVARLAGDYPASCKTLIASAAKAQRGAQYVADLIRVSRHLATKAGREVTEEDVATAIGSRPQFRSEPAIGPRSQDREARPSTTTTPARKHTSIPAVCSARGTSVSPLAHGIA